MPKITLERNTKTGGWDKKSKALPSEVEQKKQGSFKPEMLKPKSKKTPPTATTAKQAAANSQK